MLIVQVSSDKRSTRIIKKYFKALGRLVEGIGAVGIPFNSFRDFSRDEPQRKTHLINKWLKGRCHKLKLIMGDFICHQAFWRQDGVHLSNKGEKILVHELAGLLLVFERAFV